jgi:hypothetical protein
MAGMEARFFTPLPRQELDLTFNCTSSEIGGASPVVASIPVQVKPVSVAGSRVTFDTKSMILGQWYEFQKNDKKYLAVMKSAGIIDIYRIRE